MAEFADTTDYAHVPDPRGDNASEGHFADKSVLADYKNPDVTGDIFTEHAGLFFNRGPAGPVTVGGYRPIPGAGGLLMPGAGLFFNRAPAVPVIVGGYRAIPGAGGLLMPGAGLYGGYAVRETAGAVAVLRIRDGFDASAALVDTVALPANGSAQAWLFPSGVQLRYGLFVEIVSGTVEGTVYTVDHRIV